MIFPERKTKERKKDGERKKKTENECGKTERLMKKGRKKDEHRKTER